MSNVQGNLKDPNEEIFITVFNQDHISYFDLFTGVFILLSRETDSALRELANGSLHKLIRSRDGSMHNCIFRKTLTPIS